MMLGWYIYDDFSPLRDSVFCLCDNELFLTCPSQTHFIQLCCKIFEKKFNSSKIFSIKMSTTRSQKKRNVQQENCENVSESFVSPVLADNSCLLDHDADIAGPSRPKSPRVENSFLESLRASLKEEITSEIENLIVESQKEMLKLLKPETRENVRGNIEEEMENETKSFYTPTKSVRISSTQNDSNVCRNTRTFSSCSLILSFVLGFNNFKSSP